MTAMKKKKFKNHVCISANISFKMPFKNKNTSIVKSGECYVNPGLNKHSFF
jgi:hypothetical protein